MRKFLLLTLIIPMFATLACEDQRPQYEIDQEKILQYLEANNITDAIEHPTGIYYIITKEGEGDSPSVYSTVEVKYKGYLSDGTVFDATEEGKTAMFNLSSVIQGWAYSIPLLKRGGKGTFIIPSILAYGRSEQVNIPANSILIFEVELIDFA